MSDFSAEYDPGTGTLVLAGEIGTDDWAEMLQAVDQAFRRTPCHLVIDLRHVRIVPPATLGSLVRLCNTCYPGTVIRVPQRQRAAAA